MVAALLTLSPVQRPFRTGKGTAVGLSTAYEPVPAVGGPVDGLPADAVQQKLHLLFFNFYTCLKEPFAPMYCDSVLQFDAEHGHWPT